MPIPEHIDLFHLHQEAEPTERTAVEAVVDHVTEEIARLEVGAEEEVQKLFCSVLSGGG